MSAKEKKTPKTAKPSQKNEKNSKPTHTSAEYIIDSDIEADVEESQQGSAKSSKKTTNGTSTKAQKRKAVDELDSGTAKKAKKTASVRPDSLSKPIKKPEEDVSAKKTPTVTTKSKASVPSKTDSESSSEEDPPASKAKGTTKTQAKEAEKPRTISKLDALTQGLSDSSEDGDGDEDEDEDEDMDSPPTTPNKDTQDEVVVVPTGPVEIPSYRPPEGFSVALLSSESTKDVRDLLSAENLRGKQIWHITAPVSIPISDIKQFSREDITSGKTVIKHKGSNYGFHMDSGKETSSKIFVPTRSSHKYAPVPVAIEQTLYLQQMVELPKTSDVSTPDSGTIQGAHKSVLKQPTGLRMRYQPVGDVEVKDDDRAAMKQAKQRIDNAQIPLPEVTKTSKTPKKLKKSKDKTTDVETVPAWVNPEVYSAPVVVGSASQQTVELPEAALEESQLGPEEGESPDEKAKRKAEKAARKEERRKMREARSAKAD